MTARYRVVFARDTSPARPDRAARPMTCSTPAMALRFAGAFGPPIRLYVETPGEDDRTYDLSKIKLDDATDWPAVIDRIRESRKRVTS